MTAEMTAKTTTENPRVAYFSMEIALDPNMPTYSGGLGILAGDFLRSAADFGLPIVGLTFVYRGGYFRQHLDADGNQGEEPDAWDPASRLEPLDVRARVTIESREVVITAWRFDAVGQTGAVVPVYLLDTDIPENDPRDRELTNRLYGNDDRYRLAQEIVLGMGGAEILRLLLGENAIDVYHMNEGHSALLVLALFERMAGSSASLDGVPSEEQMRELRRSCVFTTHTPVPAGHDRFSLDLTRALLGERRTEMLGRLDGLHDGSLNMTYLALRGSRYVNGVAMRHGEVSGGMFPQYAMNAITNGVHAGTWTSPPFEALFDRRLPRWRDDNLYLRYAIGIPIDEIRATHLVAKQMLFERLESLGYPKLDPQVFTIGFARRATAYKRANLLFTDLERLRRAARQSGRLQIIYGGKAHPRDNDGKAMIASVFAAAQALRGEIEVVYVENYDMHVAQRLIAGVDVWLNNPQPPLEASGTSGMKAALNGVPSLSILDGWWIEGCVDGVTGWSIDDVDSLYETLERRVLPMFYTAPEKYGEIMRSSIALNGSFFNTQRMLSQYALNAYFPA